MEQCPVRRVVAGPARITTRPTSIGRMLRLAKAALVVLTGFLLSRLLGAVRNIVIAAHFGTGTEYAAYVAAIALPDLVFQVLAGGAVGSAFIPGFECDLAGAHDGQARCLATP